MLEARTNKKTAELFANPFSLTILPRLSAKLKPIELQRRPTRAKALPDNGLPCSERSAGLVESLIHSTKTAKIRDAEVGSNLLALLDTAHQAFQQGQMDAGNIALGEYMQQLAAASGSGISADTAGQLTGQAVVVLGCASSGFLVSASPASATVSTGSAASYAVAITPAGGKTVRNTLLTLVVK